MSAGFAVVGVNLQNANPQAPERLQISIIKTQPDPALPSEFETWSFLVFGVWCLVFSTAAADQANHANQITLYPLAEICLS